jgi:hypothetical protein
MRLALDDPSGTSEPLFEVGDTVRVEPHGRFVGFVAVGRVTIREMPGGREVASVDGGIDVAFAGDTALVTVRQAGARGAEECLPPTAITAVDLRSGAQRAVVGDSHGLVAVGGNPETVVGNVRSSDCTVRAGFLDVASGSLRTLPGEGTVVAVHPDLARVWVRQYPDADHPFASLRIVDAKGDDTGSLPFAGDVAYDPSGRVAYTEPKFDGSGVVVDSTVHVGTVEPRPSDAAKRLLNEGNLVASVTGGGFAMRSAVGGASGFEAEFCTVALDCRALPLTWQSDVTLLAIVPATLAGAP